MDLKLFFGRKNVTVFDLLDGYISEKENSSDDDNHNLRKVLDRESDEVYLETEGEVYIDAVIPETDSEGDIAIISLVKPPPLILDKPEWRSCHLRCIKDEKKFFGIVGLPLEIRNRGSPYQLFNFFFTNDIIREIVYQSNLYCMQTRPKNY